MIRSVLARAVLTLAVLAVRASLLVSARPAALLVRRVFRTGGARTAAVLERHAPGGVTVQRDVPYADGPDALLDVVLPAGDRCGDCAGDGSAGPRPLVVWVHGGGFVGGSKEELAGYFAALAARGYVVAAPRYSLAPEHRYPTPTRQVLQALRYLQDDAARFGLDPERVVLAGDSAGAHIAAQVATLVTGPGYARRVGLEPSLLPRQLRGVVLACGPFDLALADHSETPLGRLFIRTVLWAYSGRRRFRADPAFAAWSITDHATAAFPPALVTVGNADPLREHSYRLAEVLRGRGVHVRTLFWPADHQPPLGHEYQFDLDRDEARRFLDELLGFLDAQLGDGVHQRDDAGPHDDHG